MKAIFLFVSALFHFSAHSALAPGPIIVGGGSGESEYSFIFAQKNLNELLTECRNITCSLTENQKQLVDRLSKKAELLFTVEFKSESNMGTSLYRIDLNTNLLEINKDLLWLDEKRTRAYQIADAFSLWIDILATAEQLDTAEIRPIQARIKDAYQKNIERVSTDFSPGNTFELVVWKQGEFDQFYVRDPALQNIDLSKSIQSQTPCERFKIFSPAWVSASPVSNLDPMAPIFFQLSFGYKAKCQEQVKMGTGRILFSAKLNRNSKYEIDLKSIEINHLQ